MKTDIASTWVTALETGRLPDGREVHQATGWLKNNARDVPGAEGNCCLGVLCELAVLDGVIDSPISNDREEYFYDEESQELPESVRLWAGLESRNPSVKVKYHDEDDGEVVKVDVSLAELNDEWEYDFPKIAQVIRKNIKKGVI